LLLVVLAAACGSGTDGGSVDSPGSTPSGPGTGSGDNPGPAEAEAPGPWVPSRDLALERFALETALQSALQEPVGSEFSDSTVWTLTGDGVELGLRVSSWLDGAEAEQACAAAAGDGASLSMSLGRPTWTTADAVYLARDANCIRVSVVRSSQADLAGAGAVAEALVAN